MTTNNNISSKGRGWQKAGAGVNAKQRLQEGLVDLNQALRLSANELTKGK